MLIVTRYNVVAVALAARALAINGALFDATIDPLSKVFGIERGHRSLEPDLEVIDHAFHERDDLQTAMIETLMDAS